jgi:hypothetical protein
VIKSGASLLETVNNLNDARTQGYIDEAHFEALLTLGKRSLGATRELIKYLESCDSDAFGRVHDTQDGSTPASTRGSRNARRGSRRK